VASRKQKFLKIAIESHFVAMATPLVTGTVDFNLLRSAELTVRDGYEYFIVLDGQDSVDKSLYFNPGSLNVSPTYGMITKPRASNVITMLHSKPEGVFSYHASTVVANLKAKYGIE
jgi:hypothetical protein